jgi:hypothetical protein
MKIRPVGAELFHADRRTNIDDEANSHFFAIFRRRLINVGVEVIYKKISRLLKEALHRHFINPLKTKRTCFI